MYPMYGVLYKGISQAICQSPFTEQKPVPHNIWSLVQWAVASKGINLENINMHIKNENAYTYFCILSLTSFGMKYIYIMLKNIGCKQICK
jgi:hypothetical protein